MSLEKRFGSILVDFFVLGILYLPFVIILEIFDLTHPGSDTILERLIGFLMYLVYANKDYYKSKSFGKRFFGLKVVNKSDLQCATRLKCFIRNLTLIIWPIELFVLLFSHQDRLGDMLVGTTLIDSEKETWKSIFVDIKAHLKILNIMKKTSP